MSHLKKKSVIGMTSWVLYISNGPKWCAKKKKKKRVENYTQIFN